MTQVEPQVVELRQYTLRRGRRDELIALFERELVTPQNALGAQVLGTFRDLDDPDRFVWLRGFADLDARTAALETFYGGPVWQANRNAANATMIDSDNVLLLRRLSGSLTGDDCGGAAGLLTANVHYLGRVEAVAFASFFDQVMSPRWRECGASPFLTLVSETRPNTYTRLPIREQESVFVWLSAHRSVAEADESATRFARLSGWRDEAPEAILPAIMRKPERLRLAPTSASRLGKAC